MMLREADLGGLVAPADGAGRSSLAHRCFLCACGLHVEGEILVVSFAGQYGAGSAGNPDGAYMGRVVERAMMEYSPRCVVLDLRELAYTHGDAIGGAMVGVRRTRPGARIVIIVSDKCHQGILSLITFARMTFEQLYGYRTPAEFVVEDMTQGLTKAHELLSKTPMPGRGSDA